METKKQKILVLGGLSLGMIWVAVYYLCTPAYVAALPPVLADSSRPKAGQQTRTDGLQWMGVVPASAADRQEDSRPLAEVIAALTATRNPAEALKVFQIIEECESLRAPFEIDPMPPFLLSQKKRCASITDVMRRSRYDYLRTAAYAGSPGVGSDWYRHGPSGDMDALRTRMNDPSVIEWKQQARALVIRDGDLGDFNALQDLMVGYSGTTPMFDADPSQELAYAIAYKDVVDLLKLGMPVPNQPTDAELNTLAAKLSQEQVAWAKAKAVAIVAARRNRTTVANQ
ncbi:hypothetical protein AAKU55_004386 [Oxalobacteraceae bacterium GrIS 1.11]